MELKLSKASLCSSRDYLASCGVHVVRSNQVRKGIHINLRLGNLRVNNDLAGIVNEYRVAKNNADWQLNQQIEVDHTVAIGTGITLAAGPSRNSVVKT